VHVYLQAKRCPWSAKDLDRDPSSATIINDLWLSDVELSKEAEPYDTIGVDIE